MKKTAFAISAFVLYAAACGGGFHDTVPHLDLTDPLTCAKAYSVEIDEHVNGTDGFFPAGVLGERFTQGFNVAVGGNYVCHGIRTDAPIELAPQGVYGISIWAAIRARTFKSTPKVKDQDGKEVREACLFLPEVRKMIFALREVEENGQKVYRTTSVPAPQIGLGYMTTMIYKGKYRYYANWIHKMQFALSGESAKTKGSTIEWQNETATGKIMGVVIDASGESAFMDQVEFTEEQGGAGAAIAWLNNKAGIAATE